MSTSSKTLFSLQLQITKSGLSRCDLATILCARSSPLFLQPRPEELCLFSVYWHRVPLSTAPTGMKLVNTKIQLNNALILVGLVFFLLSQHQAHYSIVFTVRPSLACIWSRILRPSASIKQGRNCIGRWNWISVPPISFFSWIRLARVSSKLYHPLFFYDQT